MKIKRLLCSALAAVLAFALTACVSSAPPEGGDPVQRAEAEYEFKLVAEVTHEEKKAGDGTMLAEGSYELPRLTLVATVDGEEIEPIESEATAKKFAVCDAFNAEMEEYRQAVQSFFREISGWAEEQYADHLAGEAPWYSAYADEVKLEKSYQTPGGLLSIYLTGYSFTGGAHPNGSFSTWNFDLNTGEFISYEDLAADEDEFRNAVVSNILNQIYEQGLDQGYYDDFESYVRDLAYTSVYYDESGMSVLFEEYTMGPHAMGVPAFSVPYEYFINLMNERGKAMLLPGLSQETLVLSDFREAQELWNAFNMTTLPLNMEKTAEADGMTYGLVEYRSVKTMADLHALLLTRFDGQLADRMLETPEGQMPHYRDLNGMLYGLQADRGSDISRGDATYAVEFAADGNGGKVIATVEELEQGGPVFNEETGEYDEIVAGYSTIEFPFVLTPDGAQFTQFESIW